MGAVCGDAKDHVYQFGLGSWADLMLVNEEPFGYLVRFKESAATPCEYGRFRRDAPLWREATGLSSYSCD